MKNKVWVVYGTEWGWEEEEDARGVCLGVFSSEEKAEEYIEKHPFKHGFVSADSYEMDEF